jgi:hypothetical protein
MPALTESEIIDMVNIPFQIFVETGTYLGETTKVASGLFETVHTIEIAPHFYQNAKKMFSGTNVTCHLGDSSIVLKDICPTLDRPTCFWLDGHWSAGNTGKGIKNVPLYEELELIMNLCSQECVILIDDCRLFGKTDPYVDGWEVISVEKILELVNPRIKSHSFFPSNLHHADRLAILLTA